MEKRILWGFSPDIEVTINKFFNKWKTAKSMSNHQWNATWKKINIILSHKIALLYSIPTYEYHQDWSDLFLKSYDILIPLQLKNGRGNLFKEFSFKSILQINPFLYWFYSSQNCHCYELLEKIPSWFSHLPAPFVFKFEFYH